MAMSNDQMTTPDLESPKCGPTPEGGAQEESAVSKHPPAEEQHDSTLCQAQQCSEVQQKAQQKGKPSLWPQVLCALVTAITQLSIGFSFAFSGVRLTQMTDPKSTDLILKPSEAALFASLTSVGSIFGSQASSLLTNLLGYRVTLLITLPFHLVSWISIYLSPSALLLNLARFLQGATMAIFMISSQIYVVELASTRYRGMLTGILDTLRGLGVLFMFCLGSSSLTWRHLALLSGFLVSVPPFVGLFFFPSSPRWLASRGRYEDMEKALQFFRGREVDITEEMQNIKSAAEVTGKKVSWKNQFSVLRDGPTLKRFLVFAFSSFVSQFTGHLVLIAYTVSIFEETHSGMSSYVSTILVGFIRLLGVWIFMLLVDRLRRIYAILGALLISFVGLACTGAYFYVEEEISSPELLANIRLLPLISLLFFTFGVSIAIPIMSLHQKELLPLTFRSTGGALLYVIFSFGSFAANHSFPYLSVTLRLYGTFWLYAGVCLLLAFVPLALLPETHGKSLEEIELSLRSRKEKGSIQSEGTSLT